MDEDDHDLLTFGEAGERLRLEIADTRAQVAELTDPSALEKARARLAGLEAAAQRYRERSLTDANFAKFFGYSPTGDGS